MREQVEQLAAQVQQLAGQQESELKRSIEWSKTLGERVDTLGDSKCSNWAEQHADELKGYIGWSEHMGEQHGTLETHMSRN